MIYFPKHRHSTELIKTVWQEQKGSGSCSYIRHKKNKNKNKSVHKHTINNEKWNTFSCARMSRVFYPFAPENKRRWRRNTFSGPLSKLHAVSVLFNVDWWAWSLPITWQRWLHTIRSPNTHSRKPHATRKLHFSIFYRTGLIADQSFSIVV